MKKLYVFIVVYLVLFQPVAYSATPFRFALFTDLHISTSNSVPAEDLRSAVNEVNSTQAIDFVLIAGDIANLGDTASLKVAKQLLQGLKIPFYIVPGNHDFHWNINKGASDFIRVFGDDKFVFTHKGFVFAGFATVPFDKSGSGYIQLKDIEWVKKSLLNTGQTLATFIVTHYPLLAGDVDNWKDMTDMLKQFNVKAFLNGHYHRNVLLNYDGFPGIVNRSTLRGKEALGGYSLYTLGDTLTVSEKRIGQPEVVWLELPLE
jgi:3',5'-cyclic AMP phosphodiesterase CpdA